MANTQKYLNHLLQSFGFSPAGSGDEQNAAEEIATIFKNHGFDAQIEPVIAKTGKQVPVIVFGCMTFIGAILTGFGGFVFWLGLLLSVASAVLFVLDRKGNPVIKPMGKTIESQNVVAYHKASGPLASPRNRPVVVVAHYDSPHMDPLCDVDKAHIRPLIAKLMPLAIILVPFVALIKAFPIPAVARTVVWIVALLVALIPAAAAIHGIIMMMSKQYSTGSVCNKSSVAAMLGIMDKVAPFEGEEFPEDIPFDEYMDSLPSLDFEEMAEVSEHVDQDLSDFEVQGPEDEEAIDLGSTNAMPALDSTGIMEALDSLDVLSEDEEEPAEKDEEAADEADEPAVDLEETEEEQGPAVVKPSSLRRGEETLRNLGMLPVACEIIYELSQDEPADETVEDESEADDEPVVEESASVPVDEIVEMPASQEDVAEDITEDVAEDVVSDEVELEELVDESDAAALEIEEPAEPTDEYISSEDIFEPVVEQEEEEVAQPEEDIEEDLDRADALFEFDSSEFDVMAASDNIFSAAPVEEVATPVTSQQKDAQPDETQAFSVDQVKAAQDAAVDALMAEISKPVTQAPTSPTKSDQWGVSSYKPTPSNDSADLGATVAVPAPIVDIAKPAAVNPMSVPTPNAPSQAQRSSLFDLPDPASKPNDPFSVQASGPVQIPTLNSLPQVDDSALFNNAPQGSSHTFSQNDDTFAAAINPASFEVLSAPVVKQEEKSHGGISRLFGRKKKEEQSMSDWLGVDNDFSAKESGRNIGSWDNFDNDWKGGAASSEGATPEEMLEAVTSLGDDELLGHDIWFVATGASECGHAGMEQFLIDHRDKLRGVFMINLESVGAGETSIISREGMDGKLKGDRRIASLLKQVSQDFHKPFESVEMPYLDTEASAALNMHLRAVTIAGVDGPRMACSYSHDDVPQNIDSEKIDFVAEVVTEVIRRS